MESITRKKIVAFTKTYNHAFRNGRLKHAGRVREYALMLAKKENADRDIVEIAALLHNIGYAVKSYGHPPLDSARISGLFLKDVLSEGMAKRVAECIRHHRAIDKEPESVEAKIIAAADSLAFLEDKGMQFFVYKLSRGDIKGMRKRISRIMGKIKLESARRIAAPLFEESARRWRVQKRKIGND